MAPRSPPLPFDFLLRNLRSARWGAAQPCWVVCGEFALLCIVIVENFRGLGKRFIELKYSNRGIDSPQGAKHAKFGGERWLILEKLFTAILRPLRPWRLCARY